MVVTNPTSNKYFNAPASGSFVGTWDQPVDYNFGVMDLSLGGNSVVSLAAGSVTLSSGQYACTFITVNGNNAAAAAVTIPHVGSFYTVQNLTSNSSNAVTFTTGTGQIVGIPPGGPVGIWVDVQSSNVGVKFRSLPVVGTYWDYGGSSVPNWVSACTVPPFLNCDGTAFSSATYPALRDILGAATLPDARGRTRFVLNQATGRLTSTSGIDGNTLLAGGGTGNGLTVAQANLPNVNFPVTDPGHVHSGIINNSVLSVAGPGVASPNTTTTNTGSAVTGITVGSGGSGTAMANAPPGYVGGLTLIRAA